MKTLTESDVLRIIREEHDLIVEDFFKLTAKNGDKEKNLLSSELKVRHRKSGILYTIDSVSPRDVVLTTPEGKKILVGKDELEKDYELD
jgi:hypothetical protein